MSASASGKDQYLKEDASGGIQLEDGTGTLLIEDLQMQIGLNMNNYQFASSVSAGVISVGEKIR